MTSPDQERPHSCESSDSLEVLLFESSPYGNVDAIVQHDLRSVYFYLQPKNGEFAPRACWVRNLIPGPYIINQDDLLNGRPVVLPKAYAKSDQAGRMPLSEALSIVWFEEGNGAALLESQEVERQNLLAIIPPWSGQEGFHGYAAECVMDSPVCWPLPKNPRLQQRVQQAAEFWSSFLQPPDPFVGLRDSLLATYQNMFSESAIGAALEHQYFDISGNQFPPRGMMQYSFGDRTILSTVGMSLCPQPNVELSTPELQKFRRIELAIELPASFDPARIGRARQQLAQLAGYPWRNFRWLGLGHTCEFAGVFTNVNSMRLVETSIEIRNPSTLLKEPILPGFRNDRINLLWLEPVQ